MRKKRTRFSVTLPQETLERVREMAGGRREEDFLAELVEEGLRSVRSRQAFEGLRKGVISLARASEMIGVNPWEIYRAASREEVVQGDVEEVKRAAEALGKNGGSLVVDASVLVPLYDAGLVAEFSQALRKLGIGSPVIPYSIFTVVYGFAKTLDPEEDVSKPLRIYKVLEISGEEKEKAASMDMEGLAYVDKEAVFIARREGLALLTNDVAVAGACRKAGVTPVSLASVLLSMLRSRAISPGSAAEVVYGMQWTGPRLRDEVIELLLRETEAERS